MKKTLIMSAIFLFTAVKSYAPPAGPYWVKVVNDYGVPLTFSNSVAQYVIQPGDRTEVYINGGTYTVWCGSFQGPTLYIGDKQKIYFYNGGYSSVGYSTAWDCFWQGIKISGVLALTGYGLTLFMRMGKSATVDPT